MPSVLSPLHVGHGQVPLFLELHIDLLVLDGLATGAEEPLLLGGRVVIVLVGQLDLLQVHLHNGVRIVLRLVLLIFTPHYIEDLREGGAVEGVLLDHFGDEFRELLILGEPLKFLLRCALQLFDLGYIFLLGGGIGSFFTREELVSNCPKIKCERLFPLERKDIGISQVARAVLQGLF